MKIVDEFDYVFHKAVAEDIINGIEPIIKKISVATDKLVAKLFAVEQKIMVENNTKKINKLNEIAENLKNELISAFCVKSRLDLIVHRNRERVKYLSDKLKEAGIYYNKIDKKRLAEIKKEYKSKISESSLNLNQNNSENNVVLKNINGELLLFVNGKLDLSRRENVDILANASEEFVLKIVSAYPESVSTILPEALMNTVFKKKILKAVASYAMNGKETSVKNINNSLGNLLSFKVEIPQDMEGYVAGVQNMFNVVVKQEMIEKNPDKAREINKKLKCNERSELIPASKKIAVLAQGLAGEDEYQEEVESEEIRKEKEQEIEQDLFAQFELDMQAIAKELEEEMLKAEMKDEEERQREEILKQQQEQEEQEQQNQMMKKDDFLDD